MSEPMDVTQVSNLRGVVTQVSNLRYNNNNDDYVPGDFDLAIVGMAGRFPGANDLAEFWRNLVDGVESVARFTDEEVLAAGIAPQLAGQPHYVKAGGVLEGAEMFDAGFFGVYPREAEIMDPQHRVFLEVAWHALEHAGYDPAAVEDAVGVYAGCGMNTYLVLNLARNREISENVHGYQLTIGNDKDFLPTRVAYKFNLRGPAINTQTACSTSLVATHLACQALLNRDCDMALAGGVTIRLPQKGGYLYQEGGIASPDGHCRAFDADAAGTVGGNGAGVVVIKRAVDAVADGDTIHAIIKGSAINNDGSNKVGYTAPSVEGQTEVLSAAYAMAGVDPADVSYIETHGTGTALGDPIEITALTQAFGPDVPRGSVAIGSLKTNVGHLDAAAGVAGLIKATLALEHGQLPASLHYRAPNPRINFAATPFYVNAALSEWRSDGPRRAGVSSFGIGGTNAHVVLEEAPKFCPGGPSRAAQLLTLSAKGEDALTAATANLAAFLADHPDADLADVAYTLKVGRQPFAYRRAAVVRDMEDAAAALRGDAPGRLLENGGDAPARSVAFMFTGQGSQYAGMGRGLYASEPAFRDAVDECAGILRPHLGLDIRDLLFGADTDEQLRQTAITQPALFVIEVALARLWLSWGIKPDAMIGHSIGEYVAAHLAGVMSLEDALRVVAARGRLMGSLPGGSMLSLSMPEDAARQLLAHHPALALAALNAPGMVVVAGEEPAIRAFERELEAQGVASRRLRTSHAFHSAMMDPILPAFTQLVAGVRLNPPAIPYISNVSGTWITTDEATDPAYYARHLRSGVRFADGIAALAGEPSRALLEVGPGRSLASLARAHEAVGRDRAVLTSLRHPNDAADDLEFALNALGQLWLSGVIPDWDPAEERAGRPWAAFYAGEQRRRVPLPLYPFQRDRYWIDADADWGKAAAPQAAVKTADIARWFYAPSWQRLPALPAAAPADAGRFLVIASGSDLDAALVEQLASLTGHEPRVAANADYDRLFASLKAEGALPNVIVHLPSALPAVDFDAAQAEGFNSLLALAQAWSRHAGSAALRIVAATSGLFDVTGDERTRPETATILGAARVVGQELPNMAVRLVDLPAEPVASAPALAREVATSGPAVVALRGRGRWQQVYAPLPAPAAQSVDADGAVLITGGLGRIGLTLAEHLVNQKPDRSPELRSGSRPVRFIALVDRTGLPSRDEWPALLDDDDRPDRFGKPVRSTIRRILAMEAAGATVLVLQADVADRADMARVVAEAEARFGRLAGVIHAAGTIGAAAIKSVAETDAAVRAAQYAPKVRGTLALADALAGHDVGFVVLMSSISTALGGLGFSAYAAANAFMDAFALEQARKGLPWLSVAWDGWAFAEDAAAAGALGRMAAAAQAFAIRPDEGTQVFDRLLSLVGQGNVIVSTADLQLRLNPPKPAERAAKTGDGKRAGKSASRSEAAPSAGKHARPKLRVPYVEPADEIERTIAADWENILGIAPIGSRDDFFELGGHSLLATQLVSRLRDAYQVELPLRNLFETPTIAGLAALIRSAQSAPHAAGLSAIARRDHGSRPPLSFGQERLWFLDQLSPGSALYNNFAALRLTAAGGAGIDPLRLEAALNAVVARHDALRAVFGEADGKPTQTILPDLRVSVPVIDARDAPADEREEHVRRLALEEARAPFDLTRGPLLRATLVRVTDDETVLFFTMHHIVSDGWSVGVLIREVVTAYEVGADALAPLPIQYADFAAWQREWLSGDAREGEDSVREANASPLREQLAYWREKLTPTPEPLELATDRPRPAVQTANGANRWFTIPAETYRGLDALARGEGATLFMALLAGLQTLLSRYTGQTDIAVGTPVANRDRGETADLIGFLLNTLVLRTDLGEGAEGRPPTFREALARVREAALGAYARQDVPFETLVEALQPARDMSRAPFFQVMFDLQAAPLAGLELAGVRVEPVRVDGGTAKFDLALQLEYGETLGGYLNYNTDLFDAETIDAMIEHFGILLTAAAADPDRSIASLPLITPAEARAVLYAWNETPAELQGVAAGRTVVDLFEAQVAARPEQAAVVLADGTDATWTYAQLNSRANALARCLRERGAGPDKVVALLLHRSPDMVAAMWACLKAGAGFLPIDPGNPSERTAFIVRDSGAILVVADGETGLEDGLERSGPPVFRLDASATDGAGENLGLSVSGRDLAYVIYTSGSTGQPKGVMIEHGGLAQHIIDVTARFGLAAGDRILQFAAYTFDQGLEQVFTALTVGGSLILRGEEIWPPADFPAVIRDYGLNAINLPPAYWNQVLQEWTAAAQPVSVPAGQVKAIISGGDVLTPESLRLWQETPVAGARLINAYGPTETTITACAFDTPADWHARTGRPVPIGRPLPNRVAYVVDARGAPTPIGVPGELWLGGAGVARGYLNRDALTAEKFIRNPFNSDENALRLYRTGDRVRYRRDGAAPAVIEFLGRIDEQVKIRGFRIELGEIEAALREHEAVADAAVVARDDSAGRGEKRLVAFVVGRDGAEGLNGRELRAFVGEKLPGYMVPAAFVALPGLPVTPSGKVDRKALKAAPLPEADLAQAAGEPYVAPRTPLEAEIAVVWAEVLGGVARNGSPAIGINDNFFDLGGHSLLATQIVSRLRARYPVDLPLRRLFEAPTVAGLADLIEEALLSQQSDDELAALLAELDGLDEA